MKYLYASNYQTYINHTDAGGIVYHGNYLTFYENCRRDWFKTIGFDGYFFSEETIDGFNISHHPVVSNTNTKFIKPILLDMQIIVTVEEVVIRAASLIFTQSIYNAANNSKLSGTEITIACVRNVIDNLTGEKTLKPARLPINLVNAIKNAKQYD